MADELAVVEDPESLILATGDDVNRSRPLYTGDVFAGVVIGVFGTEPLNVIVMSHPCAIRKGPELLPLMHVAPLRGHSSSGKQMWTGNFRLMALDGVAAVTGLTNPVVCLDETALVSTEQLALDKRTACLERRGVNVLRQRFIHQMTRLQVSEHVLDHEAAPQHEEIDMLEEWVGFADSHGVNQETAEREFHNWIRTGSRQDDLKSPAMLATLRRAAKLAAKDLHKPNDAG